jgi:hypothetical protein
LSNGTSQGYVLYGRRRINADYLSSIKIKRGDRIMAFGIPSEDFHGGFGLPQEEKIKSTSIKTTEEEVEVDCDGRCLDCDYFDFISEDCTKGKE